MASSATWVVKTVMGDQRVHIGTVTMTDGTDAVATGLQYVNGAIATPQTSATNGAGVVYNTAASGVGDIAFQSCVSGSIYSVVVFGK